jgi:2-polyprenyl-3-methyl-5-hydroxy-6-metoxy-1,4-benzoquinol methylase
MAANRNHNNRTSPARHRPSGGAARWQRYVWTRRARSWDQHASPALSGVTAAVLAAATVQPGDAVLDLGCGTGQICLPLAAQGTDVLGIDVSPSMTDRLQAEAGRRGLQSVTAVAMPIEKLVLEPQTFDLIVSSYALHHLRDPDKARLVQACYQWLRPGGRLVIADMMLGRGGSARDREIIRAKIGTLARRGPGGWWRIAKNAVRYLVRVQERPISMAAWTRLCETAGFRPVDTFAIVAEAGLVTARRPITPTRQLAERATASRAAWR